MYGHYIILIIDSGHIGTLNLKYGRLGIILHNRCNDVSMMNISLYVTSIDFPEVSIFHREVKYKQYGLDIPENHDGSALNCQPFVS